MDYPFGPEDFGGQDFVSCLEISPGSAQGVQIEHDDWDEETCPDFHGNPPSELPPDTLYPDKVYP